MANPVDNHLQTTNCGAANSFARRVGLILSPHSSSADAILADSGGIRAIVQLSILAQLETRINLGVPIGQFFDLIIGTR